MKLNQNFSILFWLYRSKSTKQGLAPIYVRITIDGDRDGFSTKRFIQPDAWDNEMERVVEPHAEASVINEYLRIVRNEISRHYNILLSTKDQVTPLIVKESYLGKDKKKVERKTFMQHFNQYIDVLEEKVKKNDLSLGRFKKIKVLRGKCKAFLKNKLKAVDILPSEMKLNFIVGFQHYLRTVQNIGHNTAMKYAKDLKQVMTYITIEEDMPVNAFLSFKASYKKVKGKYL